MCPRAAAIFSSYFLVTISNPHSRFLLAASESPNLRVICKIKELLIHLNYTSESIFEFHNQTFNLNIPVLLNTRIVDLNIDVTSVKL